MDTRVEVGNFTLQVGSPAGTLIEASGAAATGDESLRRALEEPAPKKAETAPALATEVEEASEATAKIERAVALGKGIGEGRALDPTQLGLEVGALLDCLERLDRKGKHKKSLQMARALATLLMLLKRWADLLKTLRSALRAAELLDDQEAIAWAKHELGTLRLAAGDLEGADRDLGQAREIRERTGDRRGLAATERNMAVLCKCLRALLQAEELVRRAPRSRLTPRLALFALLFAFLFAAAGFAAGSMTSSSDSSAEAENAGDLSQPPKNPGGNTADEYSTGIPAPTGTDTKTDNPEVITDPTDATPAPVTEPEPSSTPEPIPTPERVPEPKPPLPEEEPVREPG
jgi:tetratricopeptide (TPR) repeat protein